MTKSRGTGAWHWPSALAVSIGVLLVPAAAQAYGRGHGSPRDHVVAHSHWGNGSVSGPVRRSERGWQVRLPRGTWVHCERSCSDTLRRATIDFWESNGPQSKDSGPGYFRWDFYLPR